MSTIIPHGEQLRRAIAHIEEERAQHPQAKLSKLIEEAATRFNLGPADCEFCQRFFDQQARCPDPSGRQEP